MKSAIDQAATPDAPSAGEELHIISLIVHAMPTSTTKVAMAVVALPEARIHGSDVNGKIVVTLEAPSSAQILDQVATIQRTDGVINVAMVYQHVESLESLNAEIHHADYPT
jgi:nitrate reductase NapD